MLKVKYCIVIACILIVFMKGYSQDNWRHFVDGCAGGRSEIAGINVHLNGSVWTSSRCGITHVEEQNQKSCLDTITAFRSDNINGLAQTQKSNGNQLFIVEFEDHKDSCLFYEIGTTDLVIDSFYIPYKKYTEIIEASDGKIFLGTYRQRLYLLKNRSLSEVVDEAVLDSSWYIEHFNDSKGNCWIASLFGGLLKYKNNEWVNINTSTTNLETYHISGVEEDREGNIWVSTWDDFPTKSVPSGGLYKFDGDNWNHFSLSNGKLPENIIRAFAIDSIGNFWLACNTGLCKWQESGYDFYSGSELFQQGGPLGYINEIEVDPSGIVWFGMLHTGIFAYYQNGNPCCDTCTTPNLAPEIINLSDTISLDENEIYIDTISASDPDGDTITFKFLNVPSWGSSADSILTLNPGKDDDSVTITVIASDGNGGADTAKIFFKVIHPTRNRKSLNRTALDVFSFTIDSQSLTFPMLGLLEVQVLDMQGRLIQDYKVRKTSVVWDGKDRFGEVVPSGNYLVKAVYSEKRRVKSEKIVLMR